jgi:hypothetical protein
MMKHIVFSVLLLQFIVFIPAAQAQKEKKQSLWQQLNTPTLKDTTADDYYGSTSMRYEDYVYRSYIKSIQLHDVSFELSQPILNLDSQEQLQLSFDDLQADLKNYSYTVIHCNSNWEPSDLMSAEYIDGFADNNINNYSYSLNTLQKYTHYDVVFPNSSMRITKSGNYLLKVYDSGDPESVVITKRFFVYQNKVMVTARVSGASIIADRNYKQEIDFTINHTGYNILNPYADLKVVITQNNRWDNAKKGLKPLFVKDHELVYDYDEDNVFTAGNEYRYFDIKSIRYLSERVYKASIDSMGNQITLYNDDKRTFKRYYSQSDINGKYLIKTQEGKDSNREADYCYVKFFLPNDEVFMNGNLYVFGAFNNWACTKENLMKYNPTRFGYECTLYLKQGYYNYEYAFLKDGSLEADNTVIEGMHYETENDYTIYIYHKQQGTFYDQLIGVKRLNSMKDY